MRCGRQRGPYGQLGDEDETVEIGGRKRLEVVRGVIGEGLGKEDSGAIHPVASPSSTTVIHRRTASSGSGPRRTC
jgi:hypothetical protein